MSRAVDIAPWSTMACTAKILASVLLAVLVASCAYASLGGSGSLDYKGWRHRFVEDETPKLVIEDYLGRIQEIAAEQRPDWKPLVDSATQAVVIRFEVPVDPDDQAHRRIYEASIRLLVSDISRGVITITPKTSVSVYEVRDGIRWSIVGDEDEFDLTYDIQKILDRVE